MIRLGLLTVAGAAPELGRAIAIDRHRSRGLSIATRHPAPASRFTLPLTAARAPVAREV